MASQKTGMDIPTMETPVIKKSSHEFRLRALTTPRGMHEKLEGNGHPPPEHGRHLVSAGERRAPVALHEIRKPHVELHMYGPVQTVPSLNFFDNTRISQV